MKARNSKKTLGVGFIGCGTISGIYMENIGKFAGIKFIACADIRHQAAEAAAKKYGVEARSIDALLKSDDVDIVVNLTTPPSHFSVGMAALKAGKHVFGEKPLCAEAKEGDRLVAEAAKRGLALGCAPDTWIGAGGRLAREILDSGKIGKVLSGSCFLMSHGMEHWHPDPTFYFKPGGGPILDMAPYYLGALVHLLGGVVSVQAVSSRGFNKRHVTSEGPMKGKSISVEVESHVMSLVKFASGADVMFTMSWDVWKHGHPPIELYGTEGSLRLPDPNFYGGAVEYTEKGGDWISVDSSDKPFGKANWQSPMWPASRPPQANYRCIGVAELAASVLRGAPHRTSGALANHVLEVMHAILTAGRKGGVVKVKSKLPRPPAFKDKDAAKLWNA